MPGDRLDRLVECATKVFIRQGYKRTQMADVAAALGVAKGTLYLYVESKEALFYLVIRSIDGRAPFDGPPELPIPTPKPAEVQRYAERLISSGGEMPRLAAALAAKNVDDPRAELEGVIREVYATVSANRFGIKLIDMCARDYPELAELWFEQGRVQLLDLLDAYIGGRIEQGIFRPVPDVRVAARLLLETIAFWAVHRHWDPYPQLIDESVAEDTVVRFGVDALVSDS